MTPRERAEETVAAALRNPLEYDRAELAEAILDDLGSAGFTIAETWQVDATADALHGACVLTRRVLEEFHARGGFHGDTPTMELHTSVEQFREWMNQLAAIEREVQP